MPASPYPISGTVYDTDNSTALAGATVVAYNKNNAESKSTTTDANGQYSIDLANLTSSYDSGDVIFLSAYYQKKSVDYRTTTAAGDDVGGSESKDLYMMVGQTHALNDCKLLSGVVTNSGAAQGNVKFYDRTNDLEILEVRVPANDSTAFNYNRPLYFQGLCRVPSANNMKASIQADV